MKEFDENEAVAAMASVLPEDKRDSDAVIEVLDLIFDYYDENGDLEIDVDDDADEDIADMAAYVGKCLSKNPPAVHFTADDITAMIRAELEYEDSLLA